MNKIIGLITIVMFFISCSEDELTPSSSNDFRIKEGKIYDQGQLDSKMSFTYDSERLKKLEWVFFNGGEGAYLEFSYSGNMVTMYEYSENIAEDKTTFLIENGLTTEVRRYFKAEDGSWIFHVSEIYQYSGTNIVLATYEEHWDGNIMWRDKDEFIYDGNNLIQMIEYDWEDNDWELDYKSDYIYSDNKLIEIVHFWFNENVETWDKRWKVEHSYNGDLITEMTKYDWSNGNQDWEIEDIITVSYDSNGNISRYTYGGGMEEFTYENGKGNLSHFFPLNDDYYGLEVLKNGSIDNKTTQSLSKFNYRTRNKLPFIIK